jgi:hypothetical protein
MHPDIVAQYNYVFLWDEDLGVENFHADKVRYNVLLMRTQEYCKTQLKMIRKVLVAVLEPACR